MVRDGVEMNLVKDEQVWSVAYGQYQYEEMLDGRDRSALRELDQKAGDDVQGQQMLKG